MDRAEQQRYRTILLEMRTRIRGEVGRLTEAFAEDTNKYTELSNIPTHNADHDAEGADVQIFLENNEAGLLTQVDEALHRIEQGTFGTCQRCGREIAEERLEALPYAAYCIDCERQVESEESA